MVVDIPEMELIWLGPESAEWTVVLAHGAGAGMETPFMEFVANHIASGGVRVARFEFSYMRRMRSEGKRRPPDREPALREAWASAVDLARERSPGHLAIGGKSMGGRIASLVADELGVDGLVCLGYPFHPPGKPEKLRTAHLAALETPTIICQGTRDPFGNSDDVSGYDLSPSIEVSWFEGAGHDLSPSRSAQRQQESWREVGDAVLGFVGSIDL